MKALSLVPALAIAVLAVFATACGGDDDNQTPARDRTAAPTAAVTATARDASATDAAAVAALRSEQVHEDLAEGAALGKPGANVTMAVYEDFQCPFCILYTATFEQLIIDEYVATGKIRYEFHELPILGQESVAAAIASTCAAEQDRFWPYHQKLFLVQAEAGQITGEKTNVGRFSEQNLKGFATELGLDRGKFDACYAGETALAKVQDDVRQARTAGLRGTPSFVINGRPVAGDPPSSAAGWRKLIDDALAGR